MSKEIKHFKVNSLPVNPEPDSIYFVNKSSTEVDIFVTSNTGAPKRVSFNTSYTLEKQNNTVLLLNNNQIVSTILLDETLKNITEKVITVSLLDLGATSFEDNIAQKIIDYAIANNITKNPNQLHRWVITDEAIEEGQPETVLVFGDNQTLIFGNNETLIIS